MEKVLGVMQSYSTIIFGLLKRRTMHLHKYFQPLRVCGNHVTNSACKRLIGNFSFIVGFEGYFLFGYINQLQLDQNKPGVSSVDL